MSDSVQPEPGESECRSLSGVLKRMVAFAADSAALALVGFLLGLLLADFFSSLGGLGRLVGFFIAALYFTFLTSRLGNGQTLGQRLFRIQVVSRDGSMQGPGRAFLRYCILGIPYFLNGAEFTGRPMSGLTTSLVSILVFGVGISILYLLLFNRATKQSLHDLATGTFVANLSPLPMPAIKPMFKLHWAVTGLLIATSALIPTLIGKAVQPALQPLAKTQEAVLALPNVQSASVEVITTRSYKSGEGKSSATSLRAGVRIKGKAADKKALSKQVAKTILANYPEARMRDRIIISVKEGYDIGIFHSWKTENTAFTPQELDTDIGRMTPQDSAVPTRT